MRHHSVMPRGEARGQRGCIRRPNPRAKHYVRIHVRPQLVVLLRISLRPCPVFNRSKQTVDAALACRTTPGTVCPAPRSIRVRRAAGTRRLAGAAASVPCGIGATASEESAGSSRRRRRRRRRNDGGHGEMGEGRYTWRFARRLRVSDLARGGTGPTGVHSSRSKSNFRSGFFSEQNADQADSLKFRVKRTVSE